VYFCLFLKGKISCCSLAHNEKLACCHFVHAILSIRFNKTICLTIHCFRSESSSEEEYFLVSEVLQTLGELQELDFDAGVLLVTDTFALGSVVVSAWLAIELAKNGVAFPELNLTVLFQRVKLPPNERVVVRVACSRNERSAPVRHHAEPFKRFLPKGWEEVEPVVGISELLDLVCRYVDLLEDFVLCERWLFVLRVGFNERLELFLRWLVAAGFALFELTLESVGRCLDGHARAVEGEGEHRIFAHLSLKTRLEFSL